MKTKIKSKVLNFLQDLIRRESFIKTIKLLRKKYKIPEEGFPLDKRYSMGDLPKEMKSSNKNKDLKIYRNIFKDIEKEIEKKYYKDKLSLGSIIACHLFFNDMFYFVKSFSELGLILFFDLDTFFIKGDKKIKIRDTLPENIFFIGNNNYKYCILINEEVTQNELFDFIAGEYGKIKNLKRKIDVLNSKNILNNRTKKEVDIKKADIIYSNKNRNIKEILNLLRNEKIQSTDSEIRKIISIERKRREK